MQPAVRLQFRDPKDPEKWLQVEQLPKKMLAIMDFLIFSRLYGAFQLVMGVPPLYRWMVFVRENPI